MTNVYILYLCHSSSIVYNLVVSTYGRQLTTNLLVPIKLLKLPEMKAKPAWRVLNTSTTVKLLDDPASIVSAAATIGALPTKNSVQKRNTYTVRYKNNSRSGFI